MLRSLSLALLLALCAPSARAQNAAERSATDRAQTERQFIGALADLYRGDPDRAVSRLDEVLALHPDDPVVLDALAEAYQAQGRTAEALYHAEQAARLAPDEAAIQHRLGTLYTEMGDAARAQQALATAQRLDPTLTADSPTQRPEPTSRTTTSAPTDGDLPGEAAYQAGRYAEAADALLEVVDAEPRQIDAWAMALDALARTADPRAGETAELARLLYPTLPVVLTPAAEAFRSAGRADDARASAQAALDALDTGEDDPALRTRLQTLLSALD